MNLQELYIREVYLKKFCEDLEKSLQLNESGGSSTLMSLLGDANKIVFPLFGIKPSDPGKYFIGGSARLHLYPELAELLNDEIGDLDIVIPGDAEWDYFKNYLKNNKDNYSEEEYQSLISNAEKGIYRPAQNPSIEAFKEWRPDMVDPGKFKDTSFKDTRILLKNSNREAVSGYYFMTLFDVIDYKLKLRRDKEAAITSLLIQYIETSDESVKKQITDQIIDLFKGDMTAAKSFLAPALVSKVKKD